VTKDIISLRLYRASKKQEKENGGKTMNKMIGRSLLIMIFCAIMLLLVSSIVSAEDTVYKAVYFNTGTISSKGDSEKIGSSFAFSVERALEINEGFELGYGSGFQLSGDFGGDDFYSNTCNCVPIYVLLNYYPLSIEGLPYLTGHIGYNFLLYDVNDMRGTLKGLYYAVGAGIRIPRYPSIRAEILYMVNNGSGTIEDIWMESVKNTNVSLSRISLGIGLGF
jgi:hypothetical protein